MCLLGRYYLCTVFVFLLGDIKYEIWHSTGTVAMEVLRETAPFQAAIMSRIVCSGILISDQYVICPAHCVHGTTKKTKILLGNYGDAYFPTHNWTKGTETRLSSEIIVHDKFIRISKNVYLNNIALIKLPERIPLSRYIQPAILTSRKEFQLIGDTLVNVTGWYTDIVTNLSMSTEKLLNQDWCKYIYGQNFFQFQELCLEWNGSGNRLNLSGNPITSKGKVLGFITKSPCYPDEFKCSDYYKILVIPPFLDWISTRTNISMDELTGVGVGRDRLEINEKLKKLSYLTREIKVQVTENTDRLAMLQTGLADVYRLLKKINSSIEDSCIVWNE